MTIVHWLTTAHEALEEGGDPGQNWAVARDLPGVVPPPTRRSGNPSTGRTHPCRAPPAARAPRLRRRGVTARRGCASSPTSPPAPGRPLPRPLPTPPPAGPVPPGPAAAGAAAPGEGQRAPRGVGTAPTGDARTDGGVTAYTRRYFRSEGPVAAVIVPAAPPGTRGLLPNAAGRTLSGAAPPAVRRIDDKARVYHPPLADLPGWAAGAGCTVTVEGDFLHVRPGTAPGGDLGRFDGTRLRLPRRACRPSASPPARTSPRWPTPRPAPSPSPPAPTSPTPSGPWASSNGSATGSRRRSPPGTPPAPMPRPPGTVPRSSPRSSAP